MYTINKSKGFTIVELLIVIVVIAILAAISIVAYTGVQSRANDSRRLQDIATIRKTLELYKAERGYYPTAQPNPGINSWEVSTDPNFLGSLSSLASAMPTDPKNTIDHYYAYYRYAAGSNGCPSSAGGYYVLRVVGLESSDGTAVSDLGACPGITGTSRIPTSTQAVFLGFEN